MVHALQNKEKYKRAPFFSFLSVSYRGKRTPTYRLINQSANQSLMEESENVSLGNDGVKEETELDRFSSTAFLFERTDQLQPTKDSRGRI